MLENQTRKIIIRFFFRQLIETAHLATNPISLLFTDPAAFGRDNIPIEFKDRIDIVVPDARDAEQQLYHQLDNSFQSRYLTLLLANSYSIPYVIPLIVDLKQDGFHEYLLDDRLSKGVFRIPEKKTLVVVGQKKDLITADFNALNFSNQYLDLDNLNQYGSKD